MGKFFSVTIDIASDAGLIVEIAKIVEIFSHSFIVEAFYNDRASTSSATSTTYQVINPHP